MFGSTSAKLDTSFGSYSLTKIIAHKVSPNCCNCFEHYHRHHTTENVACQKTNAGWNEYCHSSKLKHENWNMDEWMQNAISFWTAALCHQRSQLWSVHLWSSARPPTEASWMCGASENSVQSLLQLFMASALRVLEAGFALNTQGSLVWVGHHIFNDLILNSHV